MYKNDEDGELYQFLGLILRIVNENHKLPLYGRLTAITPQFLTIERKDGHKTLIKRKAILLIEPVRNQVAQQEVI
jgi:hypothetical protein